MRRLRASRMASLGWRCGADHRRAGVTLTSSLTAATDILLFFFQAEDGIRDYKVTGVQTCALPISAAPFSIFCVICLSLVFSGVRYFPVILALGLLGYAGVVRGVPWLRGTATWARWGSFDAGVCLLSVGAWLLAAVALLSWYLLLHPNIADIVKAYVPSLPLGLLI